MFNENQIKAMYPKGTEIELINMVDLQAVPSGTRGVVDFVDDAGTIQMIWDNDSTLGLIVGVDSFKVIKGVDYETEMKNKLEEFIERELEHSIEMNTDIKI